MQRLEAKTIHGHTYYYLSQWGWTNGKCRRLSQKYLGKPEDIARALEPSHPQPDYALVLEWGLPLALWQEAARSQVAPMVDQLCPKRTQGLSTGDYIRLAAINRACEPVSKQAMWDWLSRTCLPRFWPEASAAQLTSQHFWDHMDRMDADTAQKIWQQLITAVLAREQISLSQVCYDGTNFYTFIDTFNFRCHLAQRGKNKQGRSNLRQVSYALFCTSDGHLPLFYDVYAGNHNDVTEFPQVLEKFQHWLKERAGSTWATTKPTLIFDKGNNSADNFALVDTLELPYVGSVKLEEHPDLMRISNQDERWQPLTEPGLEGTKSWRTQQVVYDKERTLVLTYNERLYDSQWATVQHDLAKALRELADLQRRLQDRAEGRIKGGTVPTVPWVERKCEQMLHRQHLRQLVQTVVTLNAKGLPQLSFEADAAAQQHLADTFLGKTLLITGHQQWSDAQIIRAYRSQFVIEKLFHEMKDRRIGAWWPLHHWTDSKIQVHGLYCTIAMLLRALLWRRAQKAGLHLSMAGLLEKLDRLRQVINVFPAQRAGQPRSEQEVLTQRDEIQEKLIEIFGLPPPKSTFRG
jgi:transposase